MSYTIARNIEGISLNGKEFILEDDNSKIKTFDSPQSACTFLKEKTGVNKTIEEWDEGGIYIEEE